LRSSTGDARYYCAIDWKNEKEELRSVGWSQDPEEIPEVLMVIKVHDTMSTFLSNLAAFSRWLELLQEKVSTGDVWPRIAR
jgi:hypothetical protein